MAEIVSPITLSITNEGTKNLRIELVNLRKDIEFFISIFTLHKSLQFFYTHCHNLYRKFKNVNQKMNEQRERI